MDVIEPTPPVDVDWSIGDVLGGLKFAVMRAAEAKRGRAVVLGDFTYFHLDGN